MRFAVGYMNNFDNNLIVEIVCADNHKEAILQHSSLQDAVMEDWIKDMPSDLKTIKEMFFDGDSSIDVVEIPSMVAFG